MLILCPPTNPNPTYQEHWNAEAEAINDLRGHAGLEGEVVEVGNEGGVGAEVWIFACETPPPNRKGGSPSGK